MAKPTRFAAVVLNAAAASIAPLLAMDSKVTLPKDQFTSLTTKNFKDKRTDLLSGVRTAIDGKLRKGLALDASMQDFAKAIDVFGGMEAADEPSEKPDEVEQALSVGPIDKPEPQTKEFPDKGGTFDAEPMKSFLREKGMGEDDIAKVCDMMPAGWQDIAPGGPGAVDSDEEKKKKEAEEAEKKAAADKAAKDAEMKDKDLITKPAMDAAIKSAVGEAIKNQQGIRAALADVHPWTGDIPASMAFDSAADVYRQALTMRNVDGAKTMHPDALQTVLKTLPKIGARAPEHVDTPAIAMDAVNKAIKFAPGLEHISTDL